MASDLRMLLLLMRQMFLLCLYAVVVIAVAGLSSLEEWLIHLRFQTYQKNRRTLLRRPMGGEQRENG